MTVPRPLMQNNYVFFFQFRKIYVRILCLDAAMSYSMRLFKPCVTSRAIASHVLGDGRRRVWNTPGAPTHIWSLAATENGRLMNSSRHTRILCLYVFCFVSTCNDRLLQDSLVLTIFVYLKALFYF